jgi:hypothetical protein
MNLCVCVCVCVFVRVYTRVQIVRLLTSTRNLFSLSLSLKKNFLTNPPKKGHVGLLRCRSSNGKRFRWIHTIHKNGIRHCLALILFTQKNNHPFLEISSARSSLKKKTVEYPKIHTHSFIHTTVTHSSPCLHRPIILLLFLKRFLGKHWEKLTNETSQYKNMILHTVVTKNQETGLLRN